MTRLQEQAVERQAAHECMQQQLIAALENFVKLCDAFGPNSDLGRAAADYRLQANAVLTHAKGIA